MEPNEEQKFSKEPENPHAPVKVRRPILSSQLSVNEQLDPTPAPARPSEPEPPETADYTESAPPAVTGRQRLLQEEMDPAPSEVRQPVVHIGNYARPKNNRQNKVLLQMLALVFLSNLLVISAAGTWLYHHLNSRIESRPVAAGGTPSPRAAREDSPRSSDGPSRDDITRVEESVRDQSTTLADLQAQLQAAQKRLSDAENLAKQQATRLEQLAQAPAPAAAAPAVPAPGAQDPLNPALTPSAEELILLKERNRLTSYADESIATGARKPYDQLWEAMEDGKLGTLTHAARAEILRVQNYYLSGTRLDRYDIPVADYYPESASLRDSQLSDEKLIKLLENADNPWQVRLKSANLLGLRRSTAVGDALVKAIKKDPNLDVVKEATFSFEQMTGYRARLFEATTLSSWWKQYNEAPQQPAPKAAEPKKEEAPSTEPTDKKLPELKVPQE